MKHPEQRQPLISWEQFFPIKRPLELELGMGRANYLFERAAACPEHNIIGIEYKKAFVEQANAKRERENIDNALAIFGNAWFLVPELFDDDLFCNVTFNFPDPWWKKRHHKRRIINKEFTDIVVKKLKSGGTFLLQTDVLDLYESYSDILNAHPDLSNKEAKQGLSMKNPMNAKSHREKKCEELFIPIYRVMFTKN